MSHLGPACLASTLYKFVETVQLAFYANIRWKSALEREEMPTVVVLLEEAVNSWEDGGQTWWRRRGREAVAQHFRTQEAALLAIVALLTRINSKPLNFKAKDKRRVRAASK